MQKELLIFGANGFLGKGLTKILLSKDYNKIYLFDLNIKLDRTEERIIKIPVPDLSNEDNVAEVFKEITPSKEKVFFLYSTVGGFAGGNSIWETERDEINKMINMNFLCCFFIAKYFSRLVKESAGGSICFTAAFTGINPEINKAAYGASKGALIHLTKTLSLEGKKINLSANAIAPYIIDTPANRDSMKSGNYDEWTKPEEVGELAHFLFKNFTFISGNVIQLKNRLKVDISTV